MSPLKCSFAAFAAAFAFQGNVNPSRAKELLVPSVPSIHEVGKDMDINIFNDDFFARFTNQVEQMMAPLFDMPGAFLGMPMRPAINSRLSLSLPDVDEKSCQVAINMDKTVQPSAIEVGVDPASRRLIVKVEKSQAHQEKNKQKGELFVSNYVGMSESIQLPENCIPHAGLAGYMIDKDQNRALVIFPATQLLKDHANAGLLPADIVDIAQGEHKKQLSELTPKEVCLVAGFTAAQCEKLGNKRPDVQSIASPEGDNIFPLGLYDASLQLLD